MTALAGMAGGLAVTGLLLLALELTRPQPARGKPPRLRLRASGTVRNRALIALTVGSAVLAITRWPVAMVATSLAVLFLPGVISGRAAKQRAAVLEGLEQWTRRLSDMLTASRGLEDALEASARQAPAAIAPAVAALSRRLAARTSVEAALLAFAADVADPAGDRIAAALIIATGRRGGAVRDVLSAVAMMLAREVTARREIEADRAQHRATVKWLTLFVLCFTLFAILNRAYSAPFGTVAGQLVMALVTILYAAGLAWLHHLGGVPAQGRFLAPDPPGPRAAAGTTRRTASRARAVPAQVRTVARDDRVNDHGSAGHAPFRLAVVGYDQRNGAVGSRGQL